MSDCKITDTVKRYFKSHRISQKEVAEAIGYKTTQSWANTLARGTFSKKTAQMLSNAYGFSMKYLLLGEGGLFETKPQTPAVPSNNQTFPPLSKKDKRIYAWERSSGRCCYCRRPLSLDEITIEHITPQSKFPQRTDADNKDNIIACCSKCNTAKGAMSISEFAQHINSKNQSLLQIEAERKSLLVKVASLTQSINSKKFSYIHYLRESIPGEDDSLLEFMKSLKTMSKNE